jgi:dethiobiotin synthetase
MSKIFFVTGTDTDVGKTTSTLALLHAAAARGLKAVAYKPIAAGSEIMEEGLCNQDVMLLQKHSNYPLSYDQVVGYAFEPFSAPHIAAEESGVTIKLEVLSEGLRKLQESAKPDIIFVEGAGGWRVPIGHGHFLSDWVKYENLPVLLVVGARLGCLNHALLTYEAIHHDMLPLAGWCINRINPAMSHYQANLDTLTSLLPAPFLGEIPFINKPYEHNLGRYLDISPLL